MNSEWMSVRLADCASFQEGYVNPSQRDESYFGDDIKWLRATDLNNGFVFDTGRKLSRKGFESAGKSALLFEPGTLAISKSGTIGRIGILKDYMCGNRAVINIRVNEDCDTRFIFYVLLINRPVIETLAEGSVQKNLYVSSLGRLQIPLPPIEVQREIASILGVLDDRIELLRETNATLEAIAQALFKSWFVDFDPVHANAGTQAPSLPPEIQALFPATFTDAPQGPIPEGWSYVNLGELVCNQSTTFKFQGIDKVVFINTGDVSEGLFLHQDYVSTDGLPGQAKKAIQRDDILFSEIRPKNKRFAYVNLDPKDYVVSTKFMVLRAISDVSPRYIYQILKQDETIEFFNMIAESRSGTFPQITFDSIQTYQVLKPSKACVDKFIDLVSPIIEQIDLTSERQKELSILRDTLLPRLISGQLRLPEAEQAIAAITD